MLAKSKSVCWDGLGSRVHLEGRVTANPYKVSLLTEQFNPDGIGLFQKDSAPHSGHEDTTGWFEEDENGGNHMLWPSVTR